MFDKDFWQSCGFERNVETTRNIVHWPIVRDSKQFQLQSTSVSNLNARPLIFIDHFSVCKFRIQILMMLFSKECLIMLFLFCVFVKFCSFLRMW